MQIESLNPEFGNLVAADATIDALASEFTFTEGPVWDPRGGRLVFSDIPVSNIWQWTAAKGAQVLYRNTQKANGLALGLDGCIIACQGFGRSVSKIGEDGTLKILTSLYQGKKLNSPDDLVVRGDGSIYFSDPPYGIEIPQLGTGGPKELTVNGFYRLMPGTSDPLLLVSDFDHPNGMAFSPDGKWLYVADTAQYHVRKFQVASDGSLSGGEVFIQLPNTGKPEGMGGPDGMKVDCNGNLYTTGPGGIWVVSPHAEVLGRLYIPQKTTSNLAWGDDDRRTLFITAWTTLYRVRTLIPGNCPVDLPW